MNKKLITAALLLAFAGAAFASTRARWIGGRLEYWDEIAGEITQTTAPFQHVEEFAYVVAGLPAYNAAGANSLLYRSRNTGTAGSIEVLIRDVDTGGLRLQLKDTSEAQTCHVYWADRKLLNPNKMLGINIRAAANWAANATDTAEINIGLAGNYASGSYGSARFVGFRVDLSATSPRWDAIIRDSQETQILSTGVGAVKGKAHDFRIEMYDLSDIAFVIDGDYVRYGASSVITGEMLQPQIQAYKQTGTAEVTIDTSFIRVWSDR